MDTVRIPPSISPDHPHRSRHNYTAVVALGVRGAQRLAVYSIAGEPWVTFVEPGGWISEELNAVRQSDLLTARPRSTSAGDGTRLTRRLVRERSIDTVGNSSARIPSAEAGFVEPVAEFGRERHEPIAVSGPVHSDVSFARITFLFGDLVSGQLLATTGPPETTRCVQRDRRRQRRPPGDAEEPCQEQQPDPRFFTFPDGSAGVLFERTGDFYRHRSALTVVTFAHATPASPSHSGHRADGCGSSPDGPAERRQAVHRRRLAPLRRRLRRHEVFEADADQHDQRVPARQAWTFAGVGAQQTPIVVNGILYASASSGVVALDGATGEVVWRYGAGTGGRRSRWRPWRGGGAAEELASRREAAQARAQPAGAPLPRGGGAPVERATAAGEGQRPPPRQPVAPARARCRRSGRGGGGRGGALPRPRARQRAIEPWASRTGPATARLPPRILMMVGRRLVALKATNGDARHGVRDRRLHRHRRELGRCAAGVQEHRRRRFEQRRSDAGERPGDTKAFDARTGAKLWTSSRSRNRAIRIMPRLAERRVEESAGRQPLGLVLHARRTARNSLHRRSAARPATTGAATDPAPTSTPTRSSRWT